MKRWLWLSLALFSLSPAFALDPEWRTQDVNGDNTQEHVAVTNLADIAFNDKGQIVRWFIKMQRAKDFGGNYKNVPNLIKDGVGLPGTLSGFAAEKSNFVDAGGKKGDAGYNPDGDLTATFSQGDTSLVYKIHPRFLTIDVSVQTPTARKLTWTGIGGTDRPITKWLGSGSDAPSNAGNGSATYVSWQTNPTKGYAMILQPTPSLPIKMDGVNGAGVAEISVPAGNSNFKVYGGANELVRLNVEGFYKLPGVFHPDIWGQMSLGMLWVFEQAHTLLGGSWFWAIVVVTILLRLLLWPLMHQQYKSMAEMQKVQPQLQKIQEKYKDNKEKQQEETMKLYQEHKINPLAGCLPLFLQMPILFLIYRIMAGYEFGQGFLWVPDLALPDPIYIWPIIYVLVLLASTYISAAGNKQTLQQGIMMNMVFVFFLFSFPAGVTIYWVLSTAIGIGQQWIINKSLGINKMKASGAKG